MSSARKKIYNPKAQTYNVKPSEDCNCWKINIVGGELKAQFYGRVEPQKVYRCPVAAANRILAGAVYVCVHHTVAQEAIRILENGT